MLRSLLRGLRRRWSWHQPAWRARFYRWLYPQIQADRVGRHLQLSGEERIWIAPGCIIHDEVELVAKAGARIRIGPGCTLYPRTKLLAYSGDLVLEGDVSVNSFAIVFANSGTSIGRMTRIASHAVINPTEHRYDDPTRPIDDQPISNRPVQIGADCWICTAAIVRGGTQLGDGSIVGAQALTRGSYPAGSVLVGSPARILKQRTVLADPTQQQTSLAIEHQDAL
ncbi:acyltransferase [Synechococcus elongatus]|uniref:acyltransferase n=1 Tax=Synechococcus elongatus TaxID=32046 RepID=UPI000F7FA611|nr:acyltransferase [Synechococcus elongatus]